MRLHSNHKLSSISSNQTQNDFNEPILGSHCMGMYPRAPSFTSKGSYTITESSKHGLGYLVLTQWAH